MRCCENKTGFTILEMLIVVAIVTILVSLTIGIGAHIDNQSKQKLTKSTISLINFALTQFADYDFQHKDTGRNYTNALERDFYLGLDFPPDCNGYPVFSGPPGFNISLTLRKVMDASSVQLVSGTHQREYSGIEVMYFFLNQVPQCHNTLQRIDSSLRTDLDRDRQQLVLRVFFGGAGTVADPHGRIKDYPLIRIIDPWGKPLRYDYYKEMEFNLFDRDAGKRTFPQVTSAGPDGRFDTTDDITGG